MDISQTTGGCAVEFLLSTARPARTPHTHESAFILSTFVSFVSRVDQRERELTGPGSTEDEKFPIFLKGITRV